MGHKAGTGCSSRVIESTKLDAEGKTQPIKYTLAVLVQSNFGGARFLTVKGVPVGQILIDEAEAARKAAPKDGPEGSIIVVIATDAPLIPVQLKRLAQRATVGVGKSELCTREHTHQNTWLKKCFSLQPADGDLTTQGTSSWLSVQHTKSLGKTHKASLRTFLGL